MKKNILRTFLVLLAVSFIFTAFVGCVDPLTADEEAVVGKYQLNDIEISNNPGITVDSYDYYTIEFKTDRKCVIAYKNAIEQYYEDKAEWKVNSQGNIEVVIKMGRAKATHTYMIDDVFISGTNTYATSDGTVDVYTSFINISAVG